MFTAKMRDELARRGTEQICRDPAQQIIAALRPIALLQRAELRQLD